MLHDHKDYQKSTQSSLQHRCLLGKAEEASKVYDGASPALIISHPPYLNAFNYRPVFSLEYMWGEPFEGQFVNQLGYYKNEIVAHPASENIVSQYFNLLKMAYSDSYAMQRPGDVLSIVIGDCTRNKKIIPVISKVTEIVSEIGYTPIALNYRTTHYGTGKYAYESRADYHKDSNAKKDGILVFRK
jgi:hypothetical protein